MPVTQKSAGLEGVIAASTELSFIDGEKGLLVYRGYDIHDLVEHTTFEEVVHLLWYGELPTAAQLEELDRRLKAERGLPAPVIEALRQMPSQAEPMDVLRTAVSLLGLYDPDQGDESRGANERKAIRLLAKTPTIVAAFDRLRNGREPLEPRNDLNHASNFLYMLRGTVPDEVAARTMDIALILHADHGLNASTFSARVTAATLSDMYSAATSAVGTLKGPLHGGANTGVMQTLLEIGSIENVEPWLKDALAQKKRIMGFGHRVYKTLDPRAIHLAKMSEALGREAGNLKWYEMSKKLQELMLQEKGLNANVDFYSASTYYTMGIPLDIFTPIFAISRMSGWTAHILEQQANNRLIRPRAEYVGPMGLKVVPIEDRKPGAVHAG